MKALLLRVGIDKGLWQGKVRDGVYAPIFADGSFEFIPKSEETRVKKIELGSINWGNAKTYEDIVGRTGKPLTTYLLERLWKRHPHCDPEFETFTYGDPTTKRNYLLKLDIGDLLVFYAGLDPFRNEKYKEKYLYIIGFFTIENVITFREIKDSELERLRRLYCNAHLTSKLDENVVMVIGDKNKSRLLPRAIRLSEPKPDKRGRLYPAVSREMKSLLGLEGFIYKSIPPRIIESERNIHNLKKILQIE